uniref:Uncharacterized protein n=1 Tax=Ralstonia solanacearum CFBP2957 TaxID=859656 RepID=D8P785_RALSL|nr:exported protein of unknown function [Ralstonia solanacearum CFBP2957]
MERVTGGGNAAGCWLAVSAYANTGMASGYAGLDRIGGVSEGIMKPRDDRSGPITIAIALRNAASSVRGDLGATGCGSAVVHCGPIRGG